MTQRGNRGEQVFFDADDYELYRNLLAKMCRRESVGVWAYCLMPNHVHLILVPERRQALGRAVGETHRRYSSSINARLAVTGHLFRSRFSSVAMDDEHLMAAARHVTLNPVRAGLVERAEDWPWSSAAAHVGGCDDALVAAAPLLERCRGSFIAWIQTPGCPMLISALRAAETIGRPLGSSGFLDRLAAMTGRDPRPGARGPKPKSPPTIGRPSLWD